MCSLYSSFGRKHVILVIIPGNVYSIFSGEEVLLLSDWPVQGREANRLLPQRTSLVPSTIHKSTNKILPSTQICKLTTI